MLAATTPSYDAAFAALLARRSVWEGRSVHKTRGGDSDALTFVAAMFEILGVLYLVVARQTVGYTLGEAMLDVRYHPPRRPRFQRLAR